MLPALAAISLACAAGLVRWRRGRLGRALPWVLVPYLAWGHVMAGFGDLGRPYRPPYRSPSLGAILTTVPTISPTRAPYHFDTIRDRLVRDWEASGTPGQRGHVLFHPMGRSFRAPFFSHHLRVSGAPLTTRAFTQFSTLPGQPGHRCEDVTSGPAADYLVVQSPPFVDSARVVAHRYLLTDVWKFLPEWGANQFDLLDRFPLPDGTTAWCYRRARPATSEEKIAWYARLLRYDNGEGYRGMARAWAALGNTPRAGVFEGLAAVLDQPEGETPEPVRERLLTLAGQDSVNPFPFLVWHHLFPDAPAPARQDWLRRAMERDATSPVPPYLLARTSLREGREAEALASAAAARRLDPDFHPAYRFQWELFDAQGHRQLAQAERDAWQARARRWSKLPGTEDRTGEDPLAGPE